jgi:tRNA modification GTPase
MDEKPTIFALSSGAGKAAVAVIRISGAAASRIVELMAGPLPRKRTTVLRKLRHPATREVLDDALVFWSAAPKSETGEDMAELQVHGGRAIVRSVLEALSGIQGCRLAEPGEFTRRAFETGRLDLAEAEGLADLIDAETEAQRRQAMVQAGGANSKLYEGWRGKLLNAAALVEAAIDFSDESDVSSDAIELSRRVVEGLAEEVRRHLDDGHRGELVRDGFRVALLGPPNAGKSSLLNALARRDAAIVSEEAGTTRDVIEVRLDLGGLPVVISDTAGLRVAEGAVEQEGIRRALSAASEADLILWLTEIHDALPALPDELRDSAEKTLHVLSKADQLGEGRPPALPDDLMAISAKTGQGVPELAERIAAIARERVGSSHEPVISTLRHRRLIEACSEALASFLSGKADDTELRAEDLRRAAAALGRVTGRIDAEDILDQVFSRFCIGK